jgi:N-acetylglucosaminylphosphatidylinositol deacetylase
MAYLVPTSPALIPASLLLSKRPLLVVAHPDDESLFFGPTLLRLTQKNAAGDQKELRVLVLSSGNNYGKGSKRVHELEEACARIKAKGCVVVDNNHDLKDNPKLWWKKESVIKEVTKHMASWKSDAVITFDRGGVSGHINHRSVSQAIAYVN